MNRKTFTILVVYSFFLLPGSAFGQGEKILTLGAASSWGLVEKKQGVTEASSVRPHPVLMLSSVESRGTGYAWDGYFNDSSSIDLSLSFDEGSPARFADSRGRYDISVSPDLAAVAAPWSRIGTGAAVFSVSAGNSRAAPLTLKPRRNALFAPGNYVRDFSIEFWVYPQSMENGSQILLLASTASDGRGGFVYQRIQCDVSRNRFLWTFGDFFHSPGGENRKTITLSGPPVLPRTWSHHLIRFDADLGLLEYLVDGRLEAVDYATSTGREGGEVYTPVIGADSSLTLGGRFSGMMDEFRIHHSYLNSPSLTKYPSGGGRMETRTLDLGHTNSSLLKVEAFGGRTGGSSGAQGSVRNEYAGNNSLHFSDHTQMNFFARSGNSPYLWNDIPWVPFNPGADLSGLFRGRYVQIAADFYPGADGETSPYLSELRITYNADEPPPPPTQVAVVPRDGAVELSWRASSSREVGGYLVYYGTASGEYFGENVMLVSARGSAPASPIDVGNRTSIRIEGLRNGTLYYFTVAAYSQPDSMTLPEPGIFSREVAARPLLRLPEDG